MGPIGFPETLIANYHSTMLKITEEHRYQRLYISKNMRFCVCCVKIGKFVSENTNVCWQRMELLSCEEMTD
jgi:hypothetical protein